MCWNVLYHFGLGPAATTIEPSLPQKMEVYLPAIEKVTYKSKRFYSCPLPAMLISDMQRGFNIGEHKNAIVI